ncbi:MAG: NAD(P)/FAD-dependent oxidoreductase [Actinobacteria bacterium]|nr:NAD(P)/FAD-dependent oxidoreductase [Actinomycetota bacterium]
MPARVLVVGAGFAGLNAAKELRGEDVEVTIVDRRNFHLFQPLLYQVATAALNPSDISYPIRAVFRRQPNVTRVIMAEVTGIDVDTGMATLDDGSGMGYDYLILAPGATHSYFGHPEWSANAPGLKTLEDAIAMRQRILTAFEVAERHPEDAPSLLTFVVIGAGPTGVELAGALVEIAVHALAREFRAVDPAEAKVILVDVQDRVLPAYPPVLSESARRQLTSLGVEVVTGEMVAAVDAAGVTLAGGRRIETRTVLWAAGVEASPLGSHLGVKTDRSGRVVVASDLSLPGRPNVFVVGDLASVPRVPGVAPAAMQMGRHVARMVKRDLAGETRRPFRYRDKGSLATIGRARAVADFGRVRFGGFVAWLAWLGVHIFYLIGFRNRAIVLASWAWSYLTFRRGARIITGVPPLQE